MRAAGLFLTFLLIATIADAQDIKRLAERHARIRELYEAEKYTEVIREIDAQLKDVPGTAYADSLSPYLYKYARAHRKLKDAQTGAVAAEKIYALVKARGNSDRELEALFDLSWYYYDIGEMQQCARVDSIAVAVADGDREVGPAMRGRARQYLAFDYSVIGDHQRSAQWALAALGVYATAAPDTIPAVQWAESYTAVGVAYWHLGRIRAAEEQYRKALEQLGDATDMPSLIRKVSTNGNLGVMWQNAGDHVRAKSFYYESLRYSDRVIASTNDPFTRDEAIVNRSRTYLNLATVHAQLGDDGRARELLAIAWKDRSSVLEPGDPQLLSVRDKMADLEMSQGTLDKAEEFVQDYLTACERHFGRGSAEYARACSKLGEIAHRKGEPVRADSLFSTSIAASLAKGDAATDVGLAMTYERRARLNTERGRHAQAIEDLLLARGIMQRTYDSTHHKVAGMDVELAEAAFKAGNVHASLQHSVSAIALMQDRVHAINSSQVPIAFLDPHSLPDALYWKVMAERSLVTEGSLDPEWSTSLDLAIASLARNKGAVEDEGSKLLLIGAHKRLFDLALDVAYDAYAHSGSGQEAERFLALSEADRSILLKGRLNGFAGLRFSGVPDTITTREQELVASLELNAEDRAGATQMGERERAYGEFLARLEREHPRYFALRYGEPRITLEDLRAGVVTGQRDLLIYASTEAHLYMLVVRMDTTILVRTSSEGIAEAVTALNEAIRDREKEAYARAAGALYSLVFAPVAGLLKNTELLIIPDGHLQTVNFETLLFDPADGGRLSEHMLIQKYAIGYLLSATTAVQFAGLRGGGPNNVLAFAPGFSDELKQGYLAQVRDPSSIDRRFLNYVRQPFAVSTAEGLGSLLSAHVGIGTDASEARFREQAGQYGVLHLGTHAEMNATSPLYSRLVLSKDGSGTDPDADGYLHAYEIYELDLRAQLAVLTACETGMGTADVEGVRSLGYSFAYAGCPSLVMSLWSIDEKVSSEIITRFYKHLADGMPKHLALRQAKLEHLANAPEELALPYYWAGLVLVGDVEPVLISSWWGRNWMWLAGGVIFAVVVALLMRRRSRTAP